jgi:hypothetical protein
MAKSEKDVSGTCNYLKNKAKDVAEVEPAHHLYAAAGLLGKCEVLGKSAPMKALDEVLAESTSMVDLFQATTVFVILWSVRFFFLSVSPLIRAMFTG